MSGPVHLRRPLVLTGGPGEGKSTCAQALARTRLRTDVLTPTTTAVYRRALPSVFVVHLRLDLAEAQQRAAARRVCLLKEEFAWLRRRDVAQPQAADAVLEVGGMGIADQVAGLERLWPAAC